MAQKNDIDMNMAISFGRNNSTTTIKRKNCDEAAKDLGVLVNPEGNFSPEYEQRRRIISTSVLGARLHSNKAPPRAHPRGNNNG
eukprot:715059-Ditylum_brightwellii.AAC.2